MVSVQQLGIRISRNELVFGFMLQVLEEIKVFDPADIGDAVTALGNEVGAHWSFLHFGLQVCLILHLKYFVSLSEACTDVSNLATKLLIACMWISVCRFQ